VPQACGARGSAVGRVYRSIRDLMRLASYERDGFGYILARSNGLLNYRRVLGFGVLPPSASKTCEIEVRRRRSYEKCGRRAVAYALVEISGKKYSIHMCRRHLKLFLLNMVRYVREKAKKAYYEILDTRARMACRESSRHRGLQGGVG
jgi:hypothetical protein